MLKVRPLSMKRVGLYRVRNSNKHDDNRGPAITYCMTRNDGRTANDLHTSSSDTLLGSKSM